MSTNQKIKIGLTGHGSGGHFYPLIAVAESLASNPNPMEMIYYGPDPYNESELDRLGIRFNKVPAGKNRGYFSLLNILDFFKMAWGCLVALVVVALSYPDVIFSKGGHGAFPVLLAARILGIPTVVHDSDIVPGRVTKITEKWAKRVALAWPQAEQYITNPKVAITGIPIRLSLQSATREGGREFLKIPNELPVLLILGGSQGAQFINNATLEALPKLLNDFYVIHQCGPNNYNQMKLATDSLLTADQKIKYRLVDSLNATAMSKSLGAADIAITRAGATSLFEIALIGKIPAIIVPITNSVNDHQRKNAYAVQSAGAGVVIEEKNLSPDILLYNIEKIIKDPEIYQKMSQSAAKFSSLDAGDKIANEILQIANQH